VKEYKVVTLKLGFRNRIQKFEDVLNQFAREGWILKEIPQGWNSIVLERDKNRYKSSQLLGILTRSRYGAQNSAVLVFLKFFR
jgi:hypothetical protein